MMNQRGFGRRSVALGCPFFNTTFAYGDGHRELLGGPLKRHADK
jgi:hypothetical protein